MAWELPQSGIFKYHDCSLQTCAWLVSAADVGTQSNMMLSRAAEARTDRRHLLFEAGLVLQRLLQARPYIGSILLGLAGSLRRRLHAKTMLLTERLLARPLFTERALRSMPCNTL